MPMTWKPIDYQGIVTLDKSVVEQLLRYLLEQESHLGSIINESIHVFPTESIPVVIPFKSGGVFSLSDAVRSFESNIREISKLEKQVVPFDDWKKSIQEINRGIWEYNEVLEGCVIELFQQIRLIGIENWNSSLISVVHSIHKMLLERIDHLHVAVRQLECALQKYRFECERREKRWVWLRKILFGWRRLLDRSIPTFINENRKFLNLQYSRFIDRTERLQDLNQEIDETIKKFDEFYVFSELDEEQQEEFKHLYRLIKLWKLNVEKRSLPQEDTVEALRKNFQVAQVKQLFREYYHGIREALFERSRLIKRNLNDFFQDVINKPLAFEMIAVSWKELKTLSGMIFLYREFILKTNPDPYVRSRLGFPEWVVGPEPKPAKELLYLQFDVEKLEELFADFEESLNSNRGHQSSFTLERRYREIEKTLHEMGQPLMTRHVMRSKAEAILKQLEEMDELGSFNEDTVPLVGLVFSKALRADWQFHVFFEFSDFYKYYEIHQGIVGPYENRHHMNRMRKMTLLVDQIEEWVKTRDVVRHTHEIEMDMNDMKESLQEFLSYVQKMTDRAEAEKETIQNVIQDISLQLLEYRYLFGRFFHSLHQHESFGKKIRNQFIFVDQYFESVENRLQELRAETNTK